MYNNKRIIQQGKTMPNIYRFLIKTLCVFGVTFTLTLPHNNAWGVDIECCECIQNGLALECRTPERASCSYDSSQHGYCGKEDQKWSCGTGKEMTCDDLYEGICWERWYCKSTGSGDGDSGDEGSDSQATDCDPMGNCLDQYSDYCPGNCQCFRYPTFGSVDTAYNFNWVYSDSTPTSNNSCIQKLDKLYTVQCETSKKYYKKDPDTPPSCTIQHNSSGNTVTNCTGCSNTPCWDCDNIKAPNYTTEYCNYNTNQMVEMVKCNSVNDCDLNPGDEMYDTVNSAPGVYYRAKKYTFNPNNNGSCTIGFEDDFDCELGYKFDEKTQTCKPCTVGWRGVTEQGGWRKDCEKCPTGETTFTTKVINDKTVIVSHDTGKTTCEPCPLGYAARDNIYPPYDRKCLECAKGYYGFTSTINICKPCPNAFTSDTPNPSEGLINDSIQMCYIDPNVKLSDSLGKITLSEEIGSETKLYHQ